MCFHCFILIDKRNKTLLGYLTSFPTTAGPHPTSSHPQWQLLSWIGCISYQSTHHYKKCFYWIKIHHFNRFKIYDSVMISIFTMLCNHHHCLIPEHFHHPGETLDLPNLLSLQSLATTNLSVFMDRLFAYAVHFMSMESYSMRPFVSGFFHLA